MTRGSRHPYGDRQGHRRRSRQIFRALRLHNRSRVSRRRYRSRNGRRTKQAFTRLFQFTQRNHTRAIIRHLQNSAIRFIRTIASHVAFIRSTKGHYQRGTIMAMRLEENGIFFRHSRIIRLSRLSYVTTSVGKFRIRQHITLLTISFTRCLVLFPIRMGVSRALTTRYVL